MDNIENILDELNDYEKRKTEEIPKALEEYLNYLARTGDTLFVWSKIKWLVRHKLELVIGSFKEACPTENLPPCPNVEPFHYETMRDKILEQFDSFTCAPFTIQRLCELLCSPRKHYKRTDKFMRGLEKNLLVVSTVDPEQRRPVPALPMVNGVMEEGIHHHRAPAFTSGKDSERPESVASDVASVSDADSGISDTEDEDKPAKQTNMVQETPPLSEVKQVQQPSDEMMEATEEKEGTATIPACRLDPVSEMSVAPTEAKVAEEQPKTEEESLPNNTDTAPKATEQCAEEKKIECDSKDSETETLVEEPEPKIKEQPTEESREELRDSGSDKKRPLEVEEDDEDDAEHSPDAKQPRIFSPDKPIDSLSTAAESAVDATATSTAQSTSETSSSEVAASEEKKVEEETAECQNEVQTEAIPPEVKSEEKQE